MSVMSENRVLIEDDVKLKNYKIDDQSKYTPLLCFDLSKCGPKSQLFWCSVFVFGFYILYGYFQELIFTLDGFQPFGWYLTFIQFGYYTVFGLIECRIRGVQRRIPFNMYLILSILTLGTMGFSNSSLGYLNYPTQVIFKCCKLIPVLIGGILIQGKKYNTLDFLAASLMCLGLILFTLTDSMISPRFDLTGVFMISCALLCDALIGNFQEKSMKQYKATNAEVVLYSYGIGFLYLFVILLLTGDIVKGVSFCSSYPVETYGYAFVFSLTGYMGIQVVLTLVQTNGAFVAAIVTTCRKAVTIVISFLFFYKPFTYQYLLSGAIVLLGIYLNIYSKNNPDKNVIRKTWDYLKIQAQKRNQVVTRPLLSGV